MTQNPYEPVDGNLKRPANLPRTGWPLAIRRRLLWAVGFIVLFLINIMVELFVLPNWGLENTRANDIYFQSWWITVGLWFVFGNFILAAIERPETIDVADQDKR